MAGGEGSLPWGSPAGNGWPAIATLAALQLSWRQGSSSPEMTYPKDLGRHLDCRGFINC